MENIFVTITGQNQYLGLKPFKVGRVIKLVKDRDNEFDEDAIRAEVRETAEACIRYGCPWDYTLKDISTVKYTPTNLFRWHQIVQETLDEYY